MQFSQATDNMDAKQNTNLVPEDQELTTHIVSPWSVFRKSMGGCIKVLNDEIAPKQLKQVNRVYTNPA